MLKTKAVYLGGSNLVIGQTAFIKTSPADLSKICRHPS